MHNDSIYNQVDQQNQLQNSLVYHLSFHDRKDSELSRSTDKIQMFNDLQAKEYTNDHGAAAASRDSDFPLIDSQDKISIT